MYYTCIQSHLVLSVCACVCMFILSDKYILFYLLYSKAINTRYNIQYAPNAFSYDLYYTNILNPIAN